MVYIDKDVLYILKLTSREFELIYNIISGLTDDYLRERNFSNIDIEIFNEIFVNMGNIIND